MFDYQAGEKYRLTLIMTAFAGILAGVFFTMLLATSPTPTRHRVLQSYYVREPSASVRYSAPPQGMAAAVPEAESGQGAPPVAQVSPKAAKDLMQQWLPLAWDLSAGTAAQNQDVAMKYMTPQCAESYRKTIWTPDLAKQIDEAGLRSSFDATSISEPLIQNDGSAIVTVEGTQTIIAANGQSTKRPVKLEYTLIDTQDGPRISSFKESGENG